MEKNIINKLDKQDSINLIHMALNGQGTNAIYYSQDKMINLFIKYINDLDLDFKIKPNSVKPNSGKKHFYEGTAKFLENFKTTQIRINKENNYSLTEAEMIDFISKIKSNDFELNENQFKFIFNKHQNGFLSDLLDSFNLPRIETIRKNEKEGMSLIKLFNKDNRFKDHYNVNSIYKVNSHFSVHNKNKFKTSGLFAHGTTNHSLIQILDGNFKTVEELRKSDCVFREYGQALGSGIYHTRLDHISKACSYIDKDVDTQYIFINRIYYSQVNHTYSFNKTFKLSGKDITWAHKVGQYNRDEIVALPPQIEIKYIIEISRK